MVDQFIGEGPSREEIRRDKSSVTDIRQKYIKKKNSFINGHKEIEKKYKDYTNPIFFNKIVTAYSTIDLTLLHWEKDIDRVLEDLNKKDGIRDVFKTISPPSLEEREDSWAFEPYGISKELPDGLPKLYAERKKQYNEHIFNLEEQISNLTNEYEKALEGAIQRMNSAKNVKDYIQLSTEFLQEGFYRLVLACRDKSSKKNVALIINSIFAFYNLQDYKNTRSLLEDRILSLPKRQEIIHQLYAQCPSNKNASDFKQYLEAERCPQYTFPYIRDKVTNKYIKLAKKNQEKNKLNTALTYYDKLIKINQKNWFAWNNRGVILWYQGKFAAALVNFNMSLSIYPTNPVLIKNKINGELTVKAVSNKDG